MSSIAITGGATGTGVFSLLAPSTSTNRTLTLPDATGTVTTSEAVTAAGYTTPAAVLTQFNASGSAPVYACRAWVNFNGTGTVAIRSSGNVSSITDNGTGDYTVNFATAMSDANYCATASPGRYANGGAYIATQQSATPTTSAIRFTNRNLNFTSEDCEALNVSIFR